MISISALKEKLISTEIFIQNKFFESYVNLIFDNLNTFPEKNITQKHHIIPRYYYKHRNLEIDNSKSNLVNLKISDHIKAHWYLCNCSINSNEQLSNLYCLRRMLNGNYSNMTSIVAIDENECIKMYQ